MQMQTNDFFVAWKKLVRNITAQDKFLECLNCSILPKKTILLFPKG